MAAFVDVDGAVVQTAFDVELTREQVEILLHSLANSVNREFPGGKIFTNASGGPDKEMEAHEIALLGDKLLSSVGDYGRFMDLCVSL